VRGGWGYVPAQVCEFLVDSLERHCAIALVGDERVGGRVEVDDVEIDKSCDGRARQVAMRCLERLVGSGLVGCWVLSRAEKSGMTATEEDGTSSRRRRVIISTYLTLRYLTFPYLRTVRCETATYQGNGDGMDMYTSRSGRVCVGALGCYLYRLSSGRSRGTGGHSSIVAFPVVVAVAVAVEESSCASVREVRSIRTLWVVAAKSPKRESVNEWNGL
jgi:hypothetical protein